MFTPVPLPGVFVRSILRADLPFFFFGVSSAGPSSGSTGSGVGVSTWGAGGLTLLIFGLKIEPMRIVLHVVRVSGVVDGIEDSVVNGQCTKSIHNVLNTPKVLQGILVVSYKVSDIKHFRDVIESLK
jgi:hypothetical protein